MSRENNFVGGFFVSSHNIDELNDVMLDFRSALLKLCLSHDLIEGYLSGFSDFDDDAKYLLFSESLCGVKDAFFALRIFEGCLRTGSIFNGD